MIEGMAREVVHLSSAEAIIEQGQHPDAVTQAAPGPGRLLSECIALAEAHGSGATLDEDFAKDLEEIIAERRPLDTSAWD
jgi:hypothetical protein